MSVSEDYWRRRYEELRARWNAQVSPDEKLRQANLRAAKAVAELQQAQEERQKIGRDFLELRDRAVCSGCGQDVDEGGACDTAGCDDGEMIPASDLPTALRSMMEERNEVRAELRQECDQRQQAIDALRKAKLCGQRGSALRDFIDAALVKLGEQQQ